MRLSFSLFSLFFGVVLSGYAADKYLISNPLRGWDRLGEGKTPWTLTEANTLIFKGNREESLVHTTIYKDGILKLEFRVPAKKGPGDRVGAMVLRRQEGEESNGIHVVLGGPETGTIEYTFTATGDREKTYNSGVSAEAKSKPLGEWNRIEVKCQGKKITVFLNGTECATIDNAPFEQGMLALVAQSEVEFRNLIWQPK